VVLLAVGLVIGCSGHGAHADDLGPPRPDAVAIRDVLADVNAPARRRVLLRGVVTWRGGNGLIVQDDSGGIWVDTSREAPFGIALECDPAELVRLAPGVQVEVVGWTSRGGHSPNISPESIRILGEKPEPEPRPADAERFFGGADDCLRVRVTGLVQGVRDGGDDWRLVVDDRGRGFDAFLPKKILPQAPEHLVDAEVRMVGVAATRFNTRGEHRGTRLLVVHAADIAVVRPATGGPFEAAEVPLHAIAQYAPEPASGRRIRTRGIVTFSEPRRFLYLQQGTMGVRVETSSAERFAPGDLVEVAGFVNRRSEVAGIVEAVTRKLATDRSLEPIRITPDEIVAINRNASYHGAVAAPGDYKGCLVTFAARVLDMQAAGDRGTVLLHSGSTGIVAVAGPETFRQVRVLEPGSEVQASGIVEESPPAADDAWAIAPQPSGQVQLLLRSPADMRLIRAPSWWKPHRLAAALTAVAGIAGGAIAWVVFLRRQVQRQLALIETKLQAEAATEERHRIAREFHDTLEQDLAGITLRLDAAAHRAADDRSRTVLEEQRGLITRLQAETHDFLWDLRDPARHDGSLVESLASQTAYLQSLTDVPIRLDAAADLPRVPPLVQYQLLRIVREAVNNAVRHGEPTGIDVRLMASAAGLDISVADDGRGFDVADREAVAGHFGLRGMRERARRIGAAVEIESRLGEGTRVAVRVPVASLAPSADPGLSKSTMAAADGPAHHAAVATVAKP
jgi:signal transduction histidine kinase